MKYFTIICCVLITASCVPHSAEAPALAQSPKQQAKPEQLKPAAVQKTHTHTEKLSHLKGNYAAWLDHGTRENVGSGKAYGVISIQSIDEETNTLSFSTLFFGERIEYNLPFQTDQSITPAVIEVDTKTFHFSTNGNTLTIDLFIGVSGAAEEMEKFAPFKYMPSKKLDPMVAVFDRSKPWVVEPVSGTLKNASLVSLLAEDVQNLRAVDLELMKMAIYARHGAAFKDPRMEDYFRANAWYQPVFTMEESAKYFTELEIKNIEFIGRYEEHAEHFYESFGR